jgi:CRISPR-associated endonuclease Csn1
MASTQNDGVLVHGGIADLGPMLFVDVYRTTHRYIIEPAYAVDERIRANPRHLPKDAEFLFSLTKHEFVRVTLNGETHYGYFVMYERDGRLTLRAQDQPKPDKSYFRKSVTEASLIEKFHVDVLGNLYPAPPEKRRDLA